MDLSLSAADETFRDDVRAFLDEHLSQRLREGARATPAVFAEPDLAREWQQALNAKGWLAYHWPVDYGGCDWTPIQKYIFERECARAGAPALPNLGLKLLGPVVCAFGTDEQKSRILPRILSGEEVWCQGFSEPGAGSDLANLKTRADKVDGRYVVNGGKIWTTYAHHATHMFCLARTDPAVKPQKGISFLLLDLRQPGAEVRPIIGLAGDHEVNEVFLDNVETGPENLIGDEGQGWSIAKFLLENERGGSCYAPKLLAEIERVRAQAATAPDGDRGSLLDDRRFARELAEMRLEAEALETTEMRVLADLAKGRPPGPTTSIVKLVASRLRQRIDAASLSAAGYYGLHLEMERPLYGNQAPEPLGDRDGQLAAPAYLNARAWTIFGGTSEVQRSIIAKTVLGM
ncbi:MAG: acyl-CoA dehydrogenase family protein [Caulobacterales bacterium]|nr:acyl-CoA dehydrogenase family protein [Caulobacterales bacterium]